MEKIKVGEGTAFQMTAEAEATRYALIGFPHKKWDVGLFGTGYLIVDPLFRCAYVFRDYVADSYLFEKWNGRREVITRRDAEILAKMATKLIEHIKAWEASDQDTQRRAYEEAVTYHFGEGRLEEDEAEADEEEEDE